MKATIATIVLMTAALAACGTPEIAEKYEAETYAPDEIAAALAADDPSRRADAAEQILAMAPERRRAVLIELTRSGEPEVRLLAVGLLGRHHAGDGEAVRALGETAALDLDVDVRSGALRALAGSGRPEALDAIGTALTDDESLVVRREAAVLLDRLTGQTIGAAFASAVDEAADAGDDVAIEYDDWLESHRDRLRWDAAKSRFVVEEDER